MLAGGDTFLFLGVPSKHLWVVISDPPQDPSDAVIIVSLTTYRRGVDSTCILQRADHPFIKHATAVYYQGARSVSLGRLDGLASSRGIDLREPMGPEVLERIRQGVARSRRILEGCREVLVKQGLID